MAAETLDIDSYQRKTTFHNNHVVHQRGKSFWGAKERWDRVKNLGEGGQGLVYLEKETKTGHLRAVKKLQAEHLRGGVKRELRHLIALKDHQDLFVKFFCWYQDKDFIFLAMEYFHHGDLGKYIKEYGPLENTDAKEVARQLLQGLVILHEKHICHRDLKPQNVLIASRSPFRVKLADFGISKSTVDTKLKTMIGTQGYLAPELQGLRPKSLPKEEVYTNTVDLWAFGCLVYEILTSEIPFMEPAPDTTYSEESGLVFTPNTDRGLFSMTLFLEFYTEKICFPTEALKKHRVSSSGIDFIKRFLVIDPKLRMSAIEAQNSRWWVEFPGIFDQENGSEVLGNQLRLLGLILTAEKTNELFLECSQRQDVDIGQFLPSLKLDEVGGLLHDAASKGYTLILEMLLKFFTTKAQDTDSEILKWALLQVAARHGKPDAARLLLANGAKANGKPRITECMIPSRQTVRVIRTVLDKAQISTHDLRSLRSPLLIAAKSGSDAVVNVLLKAGTNVNECNRMESALHLAAMNGHSVVVKTLLEAGIDKGGCHSKKIGVSTEIIEQALHLAAMNGHNLVVKILLEAGADVNAMSAKTEYQPTTALHMAAENGHDVVVRTLLEAGADKSLKSGDGYIPLRLAAIRYHEAAVKLLLQDPQEIRSYMVQERLRRGIEIVKLTNRIQAIILEGRSSGKKYQVAVFREVVMVKVKQVRNERIRTFNLETPRVYQEARRGSVAEVLQGSSSGTRSYMVKERLRRGIEIVILKNRIKMAREGELNGKKDWGEIFRGVVAVQMRNERLRKLKLEEPRAKLAARRSYRVITEMLLGTPPEVRSYMAKERLRRGIEMVKLTNRIHTIVLEGYSSGRVDWVAIFIELVMAQVKRTRDEQIKKLKLEALRAKKRIKTKRTFWL